MSHTALMAAPEPRPRIGASPSQATAGCVFPRFLLLNLGGFAVTAALAAQGWIGPILDADHTGLVAIIAGVFLVGLTLCGSRLWQLEHGRISLAGLDADAARLALGDRIAGVRQIASALVFLGLIGTVIGFIIALSGVDPAEAGDVQSIAPMVGELIRGMSVALYTTLAGSVFSLWLTANYRLLASAATRLALTHARRRPD